MNIRFWKYHGTGNDFVMVDNRDNSFEKSPANVRFLCDRRFGIGGDGLICIEDDPGSDFRMLYFNSDGNESTFCGNGGRCVVAFAAQLGIINKGEKTRFLAKDGLHRAEWSGPNIKLEMLEVQSMERIDDGIGLFTGSPHFVKMVEEVAELDVKKLGYQIRNSERFKKEGINVNFVQKEGNLLLVRTYERGVEDETLSCGTGVTASALVGSLFGLESPVKVRTPGGDLEVGFDRTVDGGFTKIYLNGPAELVFEGMIGL